jgi:ADP-ribose pyrophosphatase
MEKTLTSRLLHQGRHFNFKTDEIQLPSGKTTTRDIVDHPGAVAIVPILDGSILLSSNTVTQPERNSSRYLPAR